MNKSNYRHNGKLLSIFYFLVISILVAFIALEIFLPDERDITSANSTVYEGTFFWEKSDGTTEEIAVPGNYSVPAGETMVIKTTLPSDFQENGLAIRSSLQDVDFYIDGELRSSYNTENTRLFGKNSASRYIFCKTSYLDAGKELRIELKTNSVRYSGIVNELFCGDRGSVWELLLSRYGMTTIIGFFVLFTGIITIIFNLALSHVYRTRFEMEYLGWCMVLGGIWIIGESKFRQLLVPNTSLLGSMCFVMVLLAPLPCIFYADMLQQYKYRKVYRIMALAAFCNFALCTILHLTNIADFIDTLFLGHLMLFLTFLAIIVCFIHMISQGRNHSDRLLLFGLLLAMAAAIAESISAYFVTTLSGIYLAASMVILFFLNAVRTVKKINDMEFHRQQENLQNKKIQLDLLTGLILRSKGEALTRKLMNECNGCLIFVDIDNLKKINDLYGHKAGDRALKLLGGFLLESFSDGISCRFGGDEFLIFLPNATKETATNAINGLFLKYYQAKLQDEELKSASLSAGIYLTTKGETFENCYLNADKALYHVKQNGKNNFHFYETATTEDNCQVADNDLSLVAQTLRESGNYSGALHLEYREFAKIYEYIHHLGSRHNYHACLAMITLETDSDQIPAVDSLEHAMECLEVAIRQKIRSVDICNRFTSMQYLIILFQTSEELIPPILDRIVEEYHHLNENPTFHLKYEYRSMEEDEATI